MRRLISILALGLLIASCSSEKNGELDTQTKLFASPFGKALFVDDVLLIVSPEGVASLNSELSHLSSVTFDERSEFLGVTKTKNVLLKVGNSLQEYSVPDLRLLSDLDIILPKNMEAVNPEVSRIHILSIELLGNVLPYFIVSYENSRATRADYGYDLLSNSVVLNLQDLVLYYTGIEHQGEVKCNIERDSGDIMSHLVLFNCGRVDRLPIASLQQTLDIKRVTPQSNQIMINGDLSSPLLATFENDGRVSVRELEEIVSPVHPVYDRNAPIIEVPSNKLVGVTSQYEPYSALTLNNNSLLELQSVLDNLQDVFILRTVWLMPEEDAILLDITTNLGQSVIRKINRDGMVQEIGYRSSSLAGLHIQHLFHEIDGETLPVWRLKNDSDIKRKALIVLGGGPFGDFRDIKAITENWLQADYEVFAVNYPGYSGYGAKYRASFLDTRLEASAFRISKFIESLHNFSDYDEITLLGHSYGGLLAREIIAESPDILDSIWLDAPFLLPCKLIKWREEYLEQRDNRLAFSESWIDRQLVNNLDCETDADRSLRALKNFSASKPIVMRQGADDLVVGGQDNIDLFNQLDISGCSKLVADATHPNSGDYSIWNRETKEFINCVSTN